MAKEGKYRYLDLGEMLSTSYGGSGGDAIEFGRLLGTIRRRKWLIGSIVVILTLLSALFILQIPSVYRAEATLVVETAPKNFADMQDVVQRMQPDFFTNRTEAAILGSRVVLRKVVEQLKLLESPIFSPDLYEKAKDAGEVEHEALEELAVDRLQNGLTVEPSDRSRVIALQYQHHDPEMAAKIVNAIVQMYMDEQVHMKGNASLEAESFLTEQAKETRQKVLDSEKKLEEFRRDSGIVDVKGASLYAEQMAQLNLRLIDARNQRTEAEARVMQIKNLLKEPGGVEATASVLQSPIVQRLLDQEAQVERKIGELRTLYRDGHPKMKLALAEREDLQRKINEALDKIVLSLENELELARIKEKNLESDVMRLEEILDHENESAVVLRTLESELRANKELYATILARLKQSNIQNRQEKNADARVISFAVPPESPLKPNRPLLIAGAFILSYIIAVGVALALEFSTPGFRTSLQIEHELDIKVWGAIPQVKLSAAERKTPHTQLLGTMKNAMYSESIRSLRTAILHSRQGAEKSIILLTSSAPDEGKSSTAFSLAAACSKMGSKSLLIDCDMRKSELAKRLNTQVSKGLGNYLSGHAELQEILYKDKNTGLYFIPAGTAATHPLDLMSGKRMKKLMDGLKTQFDMIMIDAPPLGGVSDALVLADYADIGLYLIRWEQTPVQQVRHGLKQLKTTALPRIASVLSRVDMEKHAYYHAEVDYVQFRQYAHG